MTFVGLMPLQRESELVKVSERNPAPMFGERAPRV
jgi:hypothetical protein